MSHHYSSPTHPHTQSQYLGSHKAPGWTGPTTCSVPNPPVSHHLCPIQSPHRESSTMGTENAGRIGRNNPTTFLLFPPSSVRNKQPHPGMPTRVPTSKLGSSQLCFRDHLCDLASLPLTSEIRVIVLVREAECFERRGSGNRFSSSRPLF